MHLYPENRQGGGDSPETSVREIGYDIAGNGKNLSGAEGQYEENRGAAEKEIVCFGYGIHEFFQ